LPAGATNPAGLGMQLEGRAADHVTMSPAVQLGDYLAHTQPQGPGHLASLRVPLHAFLAAGGAEAAFDQISLGRCLAAQRMDAAGSAGACQDTSQDAVPLCLVSMSVEP
jgi:hypothetical protein